MYKAVIFDFDGVILDSEPIHYQACCHIFETIGLTLSYEEYAQKYLGRADKDMFPLILQEKNYDCSAHDIDALMQKKIQKYTDMINSMNQFPIIPGLEMFLNYLMGQDKTIAICSGSTKHEILTVLQNLQRGDFKSYFHTVVSAEDVSQGKPSPEGYLLTAEKLKIPPHHCLVIEDSPHGVAAAKNAKMNVIALLTSHPRDALKEADLIVSDFNELMNQMANHFNG